MRWGDLSDPKDLIPAARQLATDINPWAAKVYCNMDDYVAAGLRGDTTKLPVPKQAIGSSALFGRFTHPLSRERFEENAKALRASAHVVDLVPRPEVAKGRIMTE